MKETTGKRLRKIMSDRNLKQVDIIRMCQPYCEKYSIKLAKNDLSQYINDKVQPGQDKLSVLGMALNISEVWLMGYDVPMEPAATSSPAAPANSLRKDEQDLLSYYNLLDAEDRAEVRGYAKGLVQSEKYRTDSVEEVG